MNKIIKLLITKITLIYYIAICNLFLLPYSVSYANDHENRGKFSSLPIPRFVSLKTEPVYMRRGPGIRYPILWVFQKRALPLEILREFNTWREVRDLEGDIGWIHQSMLSGIRTGIVKSNLIPLHKGSNIKSEIIGKLEKGIVLSLETCPEKISFCYVKVKNIKGWVNKDGLWGLYKNEIIN